MKPSSRALLLTGALLIAAPALADIPLSGDGALSAYGDLRLRLESDFDGETAARAAQDDRTRARYRTRIGARYRPHEALLFDVRLRSGSNESHQSPHVTFRDFSGNARGNVDFNPDIWRAEVRRDGFWAWAGRGEFPFYSLDEVFWDDDATLTGAVAGYQHRFDETHSARLSGGYFLLPVGMDDFGGRMSAAEASYTARLSPASLSVSAGLFGFSPDRTDRDSARLLNGNGLRRYTIGSLSAKLAREVEGVPASLEFDWLHNFDTYPAAGADAFAARNRDERNGYVFSLQAGGLRRQGEWMAGYYYAYIETLAVNASYSQDDWVRWGRGGETRGSDMRGHQLRLGYALTDSVNVLGSVYFVKAITTPEESKRFRLDLNYRF